MGGGDMVISEKETFLQIKMDISITLDKGGINFFPQEQQGIRRGYRISVRGGEIFKEQNFFQELGAKFKKKYKTHIV